MMYLQMYVRLYHTTQLLSLSVDVHDLVYTLVAVLKGKY